MTKQELTNYLFIVVLLIGLCMALAYVTRHIDHLADRYNANEQKQLKNDLKRPYVKH